MIDNREKTESYILVAVSTGSEAETAASLDELEELVGAAGGEVRGRLTQNLERIRSGTYIGTGKIEELKELIEDEEADGIVCDDELSPAEMRNLSDRLDCKVLDRTMVILDIFARRASTREGRIQVELAQLKYRATMLTGMGRALSRLGGGIGTRGPGETKLESDRRSIHERISRLKAELESIRAHREVNRARRERNALPVLALVGYTNAGKSTLLNVLTGAEVFTEDQVFATLDPTTRNLKLPTGENVLLTDTVGFIHKLPHHLVDAFRSTLEESRYADILIHVVDASNPRADHQIQVVYETLRSLSIGDKRIITVFNKKDLVTGEFIPRDPEADASLMISAKTGDGLDELTAVISRLLKEGRVLIERVYSYSDAAFLARLRKYGEVLEEEYLPEGIRIKAMVPRAFAF